MTKDPKYLLFVNNVYEFELTIAQAGSIDLIESIDGALHILSDQKSYKAKFVETDIENKNISLSINGRLYTVSIADHYDQLVEKMGLSTYAVHKVKDIKAPMPGLVLDIVVSTGQEVNKGDKLLILEAMKMENVIKSEGEGIIKKIHVVKGTAVDKGQLMIEME